MIPVKISTILESVPLEEWKYEDNTRWDADWSDIYPYHVFPSNSSPFYAGYSVSNDVHELLKFSDISFKVFFEDASVGQRLMAMYMDGDPVVIFEGVDSWGGEGGGPWVVDPIRYDVIYTILCETPKVEPVSEDEMVDSHYWGITTPPNAYYS